MPVLFRALSRQDRIDVVASHPIHMGGYLLQNKQCFQKTVFWVHDVPLGATIWISVSLAILTQGLIAQSYPA
jgi:ABC-type enterobactin transport system permease subunit